MRKMRILVALLVAMAGWSALAQEKTQDVQWKQPARQEVQEKIGASLWKKKEFVFADGDRYWMEQITADEEEAPYVATIPLGGNYAAFRYRAVSEAGRPHWKVVNLSEVSTLPVATGFVEAPGKYIWLGEPIVYRELGRGTVEVLPEKVRPIEVAHTRTGLELRIFLPRQQGLVSEIWALESREPIVRWGDEKQDRAWLALDLTKNAKWLYGGYFYKSPSSYEPTAENGFWRIPENYVLASLALMDGNDAADKMAYVMLHTSLLQQEPEGYWKTLPRSQWLWQDYGIEEGFYDTRFNTGAAMQMLKGCIRYREEAFCESARRYTAFFHRYAEAHHYPVKGEKTGWLVADYTGSNPDVRTHVSLNHQLAEINYLYSFYLHFGRSQDRELADKMLAGVTNLGNRWMKSDGDLHYAYFPDGTFGLPDYPDLTYKDLLETQRLHRLLYGKEEEIVSQLLASKRGWMMRNNIPVSK